MRKIAAIFLTLILILTLTACGEGLATTEPKQTLVTQPPTTHMPNPTANPIATTAPTESIRPTEQPTMPIVPTAPTEDPTTPVPTGITIPFSSQSLESKHYEDVAAAFENLGFVNIRTVVLYDIVTGWLTSDGEVEEVTINGLSKFQEGYSFDASAEIVITYHTWEKNDPSKITVTQDAASFEGLNKAEAEQLLRDMGFTVYQYSSDVTNDPEKDNRVISVRISNGLLADGNFKAGEKFDPAATVHIKHYEYQAPQTEPTIAPTEPTTVPAPIETTPTAPAHTHSWVDASCTAPKTCSSCGETEGKALNHIFGSWKISQEPTCTEKGEEARTCSRCGISEAQNVNAVGHDWKDATCAKPKTCSRCNQTYGAALGHNYVSGTCKRCGDKTTFSIHFIDVGQADAALVECDGHYMLIDGGNKADSNLIYSVLKKANVTKLDIVVGTHAHEDHIGGLPGAFQYATADLTLCPVKSYDSDAFRDFVKYANQKGNGITIPKIGNTYALGSATVTILGLNADDATNDTSIILRIDYGETSFLFTGDAERAAEQAVLNAGADLSATVLKVGHHGSDTSTTYPFLREIMPQYAIISVGSGNSYGHPMEDVLSRLRDADVRLFRTDLQGDIFCTSDGKAVTFSVSRNANADVFGGIGDNSTQPDPPATDPTDPVPTDPGTSDSENASLQILSWPEVIGRNETGTVKIKGKANTEYTITVYYKSGSSSASGLDPKTSDANGYVSWFWKVGGRTAPGTYRIVVEGGGEKVFVNFTVVE